METNAPTNKGGNKNHQKDIVVSNYLVRKKTLEYFKNKMEKEGEDKSKVQYLLEWKTKWNTWTNSQEIK